MISTEVEVLLHRCFVSAREARHKFITVEHLVLAMLAEPQVSNHLVASSINIEKLRVDLESRVAATETVSGIDDDFDTQPTKEFQRAIQNAILHVQSKGEREVSLMHLLTAALDQDDNIAPSSLLETARMCSLCRKWIPMESLTTIEGRGVLCSECIAAVLEAGRKRKGEV